ncbi:MAG: CBS domain-containing protein [Nannocystales bacterium]
MTDSDQTVSAYMTKNVHAIDMENSLPTARLMMEEHSIRHLPVTDGSNIVGLLSERDLGKLEVFPMLSMSTVSVPDAMTDKPYIVAPDAPMVGVLEKMRDERLGSAIVADEGKVVGIFTATDAISHLIEALRS